MVIYIDSVQVEVERIDIGEPENTGIKSGSKRSSDHLNEPPIISATSSPGAKNEVEEHQDIDINDLFGNGTPEDDNNAEEKDNVGFDMNVPHTDDEIADVDDSGDEVDKGPNAAEALKAQMQNVTAEGMRAQVNAEGKDEQTSTSSSSSGSGSSESGSGSGSSTSSDSEGSDEDSVNSVEII
ncbi:uncharacterized protein LOC133309145 [Gastrolobium bilobum]|uniref:uncharacterized protein LOC133309145 n=1 Tax=Gastrolobium bilobum TaxID=150636 RepID=UPI002AB2FAA4|nr:uncharacterized protein LOC133309145 [Gastrolobium bilobum]